MEKILHCDNVELKIISTMSRIGKELHKGNYIVFADFTKTGITSQDILYFDKKNNRLRFMLCKSWEKDYMNIYPVTGFMIKGNDSFEGFIVSLSGIYHFDIKDYDFFGYVEPKYVNIINDDYKDMPNLFQ